MKYIELTQGKKTIVDDDNYEYLSQWKWCVTKTGNKFYVLRHEGSRIFQKKIMMHRVIVNAPKGMMVDHVNGNGLDNRKSNLRICTNSENQMNRGKSKRSTTGYKGVIYNRANKKYQAQIVVNGKNIYIGLRDTAKDAALLYDEYAKKYHGDFAKLNFEEQ